MNEKAFRYFTFILIFSITSACNDGSSPGQNDAISTQGIQSDTSLLSTQNILDAVYLNKRIPEGFYSEPTPPPDTFQTISHIKNTDIINPASVTPATPVHEICANDFHQALTWAQATNGGSNLVDNAENSLFYQFTYVNASTPSFYEIKRVYKCAMVDRSSIDLNNPNYRLGQYIEIPADINNLKILLEYFWTFSPHNNFGYAIISSAINETTDNFLHLFYEARLTTAQNANECDSVNLYEVNFDINKTTGDITRSEQLISTIKSIYRNSVIEVCETN